jgi:hypothetical protein
LIARHLAPLAGFILVIVFGSTLALTGFISQRAGEATILFAATAFMIQRASTRWRIRRARLDCLATMARRQSAGPLMAGFNETSASLTGAERTLRLDYADCEEVEDVGGLIYVWPRAGAPIVLPTRALADDGDSALLLHRLAAWIRRAHRARFSAVAQP